MDYVFLFISLLFEFMLWLYFALLVFVVFFVALLWYVRFWVVCIDCVILIVFF